MSWLAASVIGSSVIGAIGANMAANTQAAAQEQAAATQQSMFNTIQGNEKPYMTAGSNAETSLSQLLGLSPATGTGGMAQGTSLPGGYLNQTFNPTQAQLNDYPGYQFALQTGGQAVRNADTPGIGALSGAALKDLTNFNVGTANQYYGQYFNQFQTQQNNIFNRLSSIASLGQNAAGNVGNNGAQLGTGIAQAQAAAGGSLAAGQVGVANALSGGVSNAAGYYYLNNLMNPSGASAATSALSPSNGGGLYTDPSGYISNVPGT